VRGRGAYDDEDQATRDQLFGSSEQHQAQLQQMNKRDAADSRVRRQALQNAIQAAAEANESANSTSVQLDQQKEQLHNMQNNLVEIDNNLTKSERILKGMRSIKGAISNWFNPPAPETPKVAPPPKAGSSAARMSSKEVDEILAKQPTSNLIQKEGTLMKLGGVVKNWKERYFVMDKNYLYYYKDKATYKARMPEQGRIPLIGLHADVMSDHVHDTQFTLGLKVRDGGRLYVVLAASDEERDAWIDAINLQQLQLSKRLGIDARGSATPLKQEEKKAAAVKSGSKVPGGPQQDKFYESLLAEEEEEEQLDVLANLVSGLKVHGHHINDELTIHNDMLNDIDEKVEKADRRIVKNTKAISKIS